MKIDKDTREIQDYCIMDCGKSKEEFLRVSLEYIKYYDRRAKKYKFGYRGLNVSKYVILAAIPVIQASPIATSFAWIVAMASSLCILLDSVINLFQMKDKWILYRSTGSKLMSEQRQYALQMGEYYGLENDQCLHLFVKNVENIVGGESKEWLATSNRTQPSTESN